MKAIVRGLICAALAIGIAPAQAQQWPTRPIRLICSTSPGQAPDIVARLFAERVSHTLGQQVYVENLPAASGLLGAQTAARAAPDGYTLFLGPATVMALNMHIFSRCPTTRCAISPPSASSTTAAPMCSRSIPRCRRKIWAS